MPGDSLQGDVDAVLAKALRREPAQRYAAAHALEEDVERILRGDPVMAAAEREEAVRHGLTTLFRGALSQDAGGAPQTAKAMVDRSAQRVLKEYRDRPELQGPLVLSLADPYGALEDVAGAATLLDGFVSQPGPQTDPAVLADARQKLASLELLLGHFDRAAGLLRQSDVFWTHHPAAYAEERIEGLKIRAQLLQRCGPSVPSEASTRHAGAAARFASGL